MVSELKGDGNLPSYKSHSCRAVTVVVTTEFNQQDPVRMTCASSIHDKEESPIFSSTCDGWSNYDTLLSVTRI